MSLVEEDDVLITTDDFKYAVFCCGDFFCVNVAISVLSQ